MRLVGLALICALTASVAKAQDFTQRGTLEYRGWWFPQTTRNDRAHLVGESFFRYEFSRTLIGDWKLFGTTETRMDTHHQVEREFYVNLLDRRLQRPAFSIRRVSLQYSKGPWTVEAGKQPIRWGKADILNPTDRFAPRDYLTVVDSDVLNVLAGRAVYEMSSDSIEVVVQPVFTPSRLPLLNQRWSNITVPVQGMEQRIPGGPNWGARWNHLGRGYEASLSFYDGHHYLPSFEVTGQSVRRYYPKLRTVGADAAVPLPWITLKGEVAWFSSSTVTAEEYVLYVVQAERQIHETHIVAGYAGEFTTRQHSPFMFAADRGLARTFLGRVSHTIDPRHAVAAEWAVRQNGEGLWLRLEGSQQLGRGWRAIAGWTLIRGDQSDFLGQYRRNSHASLILRYSF